MPDTATLLRFFGYTDAWLRLGIVDDCFLRLQFAEFQESEDKNHEHYRCGAFLQFLGRKEDLSDEEVTAIVHLRDDGPDSVDLQVNRVIEVILSELLTDEQLEGLSRFPCVRESKTIQKKRDVCRALRQLTADGLTDEVFRAICDARDSYIQRRLFDRHDLNRQHVEWLAQHGGNKAVRNQARQLLESRRISRTVGLNQPLSPSNLHTLPISHPIGRGKDLPRRTQVIVLVPCQQRVAVDKN